MTASPTPFFAESAGERITGVAIVDAQGRLWALPAPRRHYHIFALAAFMGDSAEGNSRSQGFMTSANRFVERAEALEIAKAAGQTRPGAALGHQLYSEDLWCVQPLPTIVVTPTKWWSQTILPTLPLCRARSFGKPSRQRSRVSPSP